MSLFSKKTPRRLDLVFDIESDLVRAAAVTAGADGHARVIPLALERIVRAAHADGTAFTNRMLDAVGRAAHAAIAKGSSEIRSAGLGEASFGHIHFVLSSPWVVSRLSFVEKTFESETTVRRQLLSDLVEREKAGIAALFAVGDSAVVDAKLFEVKINGYPVAEYEGKRGKAIAGTLAVSLGSKKVMYDIKLAANRAIRTHGESFHSSGFLCYAALRSLLPAKDFIWIQVHGELSDVIVVRGEACVLSGSFPFGAETLVRKIAHGMHSTEDGIRNSLSLYRKGQMAAGPAATVEKAAFRAANEWTDGLKALISGVKVPVALQTETIFLAFHGDDPIFAKALAAAWPAASVRSPADIMPSAADPSLELYAMALEQSFGI